MVFSRAQGDRPGNNELAHAVHVRILGKLKGGQDRKQEIIAELSAGAWSEKPRGFLEPLPLYRELYQDGQYNTGPRVSKGHNWYYFCLIDTSIKFTL